MQLPDVNVLLYAFSPDSEMHEESRRWLEGVVGDGAPFGMSELVCSSVVRIATNPRAAVSPAKIGDALAFVNGILGRASCRRIRPGGRHFEIFTDLCLRTHVRWNDVTDAYLAALAIESGCEWVTYDRGFARFPGLRWRLPAD
ncbi:MAG: type II toxin-antitoxin system VapC family toxin [Geodermatophilaceae bacterium]|nr:type II toxin-antitoxin system VapC family toxin [Geodermatophilaceae bacterium]